MDLHFVIDQNTINKILTGDDIETIERFQEGEQVGTYRVKRMAARFMVDEDKKPIAYNQALKMFNDMPAAEYADGLNQFMQAMADAAIPKASGTPLNSPSEAPIQKQAASPDGSSP